MMETLGRGAPAASFTCSYSILGAQEKQENSPLYATYLLMPETLKRVRVPGSFVSVGQNVHSLPAEALECRDGSSFPALYPFQRFHSNAFIETLWWQTR